MDTSDVDSSDAYGGKLRNLRERLDRRIINNNETILKIDCALFEPLRFVHHNHQDNYLMGSILIADSVNHCLEE